MQKQLFQVMYFSISILFSSIKPIDRNQSGPEKSWSDDNEGVLHILQSSSVTEVLPSDFLVLYQDIRWGNLTTIQRRSQNILERRSTRQA